MKVVLCLQRLFIFFQKKTTLTVTLNGKQKLSKMTGKIMNSLLLLRRYFYEQYCLLLSIFLYRGLINENIREMTKKDLTKGLFVFPLIFLSFISTVLIYEAL